VTGGRAGWGLAAADAEAGSATAARAATAASVPRARVRWGR